MYSSWVKDIFPEYNFHCKTGPHDLIDYGPVRIRSIIQCSKVYDDDVHEQLLACLDPDGGLRIRSHECLLTN